MGLSPKLSNFIYAQILKSKRKSEISKHIWSQMFHRSVVESVGPVAPGFGPSDLLEIHAQKRGAVLCLRWLSPESKSGGEIEKEEE